MHHPSKKLRYSQVWFSLAVATIAVVCGSLMTYGDDAYNKIRDLIGTGGTIHSLGTFRSDDGNPGTILFGAKPTDGYSGAHLFVPMTGSQVLSGSFWMQTIGWTTLQDVVLTLTDTGSNIWSLSGYAWSEQAGWLDFSGTTYHLSNTSFSGYAWNDGIGWVDMSDASLDITSSGAIGKVKIIGNLGGNRIFNTTYSLDGKLSATTNKILNEVRKNISLGTRNVPTSKKNTNIGLNNIFTNGDSSALVGLNNNLIFENTGTTVARVNYVRSVQGRLVNTGSVYDPIYSVVAIGADIYLDDSVIPQSDGKPRAIIALKNDAGVGGNIYIDGNITSIRASLVSEGSIYSGEYSGSTPTAYNDNPDNLFKIPNRQLYIYGSIISNNTIGGYGVDNTVANYCPYNIVPCGNDIALLYDFNHFRDFQKNKPEGEKAVLRGYKHPTNSALNNIYDDYSMVIEHDPRLISDPPLGFARIQ